MKTYVITGPSSSGKSTLIEHLQKQGFFVVTEVARGVLEEGVFHPNRDPFLFQQEIARRQAEAEEKMRASDADIVFLDRGFYDQLAYCRHTGVSELPPEIRLDAHYDGVFVLEMLPNFQSDGVRVESNKEEALHLHEITLKEYEKRGIPCISVPAIPVSERANFVIQHTKQGKNMKNKKTVFIAHPINGDILGNTEKILKICREVHDENTIPVAPYLVSLQYLDDKDPIERDLGIGANLETFHRGYIDELWLFGDRISTGMEQEVLLALSLGIIVIPKTEETEKDLQKIVQK